MNLPSTGQKYFFARVRDRARYDREIASISVCSVDEYQKRFPSVKEGKREREFSSCESMINEA